MGATHSCLLYHVIFSTKERQPFITPEIRPRLYKYIGGMIRKQEGVLYEIGGMPDHLHLLFRWRTDVAVADLIRDMKRDSTKWIKKAWPDMRHFYWQEGYGAFSVSFSHKKRVEQYIRGQEEHHRRHTFKAEFLKFLHRYEVEYDPRYVWD
jgi:REP element-mobilizing transposase RayT